MQRAVPASFVKVAALAGRPVFTRIGRYHALRWARFPSVLQTASSARVEQSELYRCNRESAGRAEPSSHR